MAKSYAADKSKASFLDLPAELRNNIYSRVLICETYVRLMPNKPTKVPALILLRTCKQIHDEAASIFYAANSFYCNIEKEIRLLPREKVEYPPLGDLYLSPTTPTAIHGAGGIFFPAPRYHLYLTRLTIDAKLVLNFVNPEYKREPYQRILDTPVSQLQAIVKMHAGLDGLLFATYERIRELWGEKVRGWEGKVVWAQSDWYFRPVNCTITFCENEEDEVATKEALRRWD